MRRHIRSATATGAGVLLVGSLALGAPEPVYVATAGGAITAVDFGGFEPGPLAGLQAGDTYTVEYRIDPDGLEIFENAFEYAVVESSITFDTGALVGVDLPTQSTGVAYSQSSGSFFFFTDDSFSDVPFAFGIQFQTDVAPFPTDDGSLPLSLDLASLESEFYIGAPSRTGAGILVDGTVDSFSALLTPSPSAALVLLALPIRRRRRERSMAGLGPV